jgi:hypothetical protein
MVARVDGDYEDEPLQKVILLSTQTLERVEEQLADWVASQVVVEETIEDKHEWHLRLAELYTAPNDSSKGGRGIGLCQIAATQKLVRESNVATVSCLTLHIGGAH